MKRHYRHPWLVASLFALLFIVVLINWLLVLSQ